MERLERSRRRAHAQDGRRKLLVGQRLRALFAQFLPRAAVFR